MDNKIIDTAKLGVFLAMLKEKYLDKIPSGGGVTPMETVTSTTKELNPNVLYVFGVVESLNLTLSQGASGQVNEYMFEFTANTNDISITLPGAVKWMSVPSIKQGYTYQVSIVNNLAVIGGWSNE